MMGEAKSRSPPRILLGLFQIELIEQGHILREEILAFTVVVVVILSSQLVLPATG